MATRPRPERTSVLVCRGCCCGTVGKHPDVDHDDHLQRLRDAAAHAGARLWTVDCLGPCERSNVVVVRRNGIRHWLGGILADADVEQLSAWLTSPHAPTDLPVTLRARAFDGPRATTGPVAGGSLKLPRTGGSVDDRSAGDDVA